MVASHAASREEDIPCNLCSLLKVRRGRLEWVQVMRSNDLILGLPHNFVQFTMLQELMASWLGVRIGTYIHYSDSLHVYERQLGDLRAVGSRRVPPNRDTWSLSYPRTMNVFAELSDRMDGLRQPSLTEKRGGSCASREGCRARRPTS
jgi:thymidylate synthase